MTMAGNATHPLPLLPFLPLELVLGCCGPWGAVPAQIPGHSLKPSSRKEAAINSKGSIKQEHPLFFLFSLELCCGAAAWGDQQGGCPLGQSPTDLRGSSLAQARASSFLTRNKPSLAHSSPNPCLGSLLSNWFHHWLQGTCNNPTPFSTISAFSKYMKEATVTAVTPVPAPGDCCAQHEMESRELRSPFQKSAETFMCIKAGDDVND